MWLEILVVVFFKEETRKMSTVEIIRTWLNGNEIIIVGAMVGKGGTLVERFSVKTELSRACWRFFGLLEAAFFVYVFFAMYTGFYGFPVYRFGARKILLL